MPYANALCAENNCPASPTSTALTSEEDDHLREILKRCPASAYQAARQFRKTGDTRHLPAIVFGIIERFVESDLRSRLTNPPGNLRLIEDLGIDSLTMMEIVMLVEDVLAITIKNEELRELRTLGEIQQFIERKLSNPPAVP